MNKANKQTRIFYNIVGLIAMICFIVLDQWTKMLAVDKLMDKQPFIIIENVFQLRYLENRGAAFGILQGQKAFFVITGILILAMIAYLYNKMPIAKKYVLLRVISVFMAAGAIGNMIDRVVNNYVVDFFYFELINFPIFNVADCYVTVAAALLMISILFIYKEEDFKFIERRRSKTLGESDDTK